LFGSLVSAVTGALGGGGLQGGLGTLINMFEPGMAVSPDHAQALNQILPK
jgi:hypothetical protein